MNKGNIKLEFTEHADERSSKVYKDKNHQEWNFIPVKDMDDDDTFDIRGDLGRRKRSGSEEPIGVLTKENTSETTEVFAFTKKLNKTGKVRGYLPCLDEENKLSYLRVIGKKWSLLFVPLLIAVMLIGGLMAWKLMNQGPDLDEAAIAYQMPNGLKNEDPSKIMLPGYSVLPMDKDTGEVKAMLTNPEGNPCYFKYRIVLSETGEELYSSGLLEPGTAISGFKIHKQLEQGTYEIEIRVETVQLSDPDQEMNNGIIQADLEVE